MIDNTHIELNEILCYKESNTGFNQDIIKQLLDKFKIDEDSGLINFSGNFREWCFFFNEITELIRNLVNEEQKLLISLEGLDLPQKKDMVLFSIILNKIVSLETNTPPELYLIQGTKLQFDRLFEMVVDFETIPKIQ